jgi:NAD(P)-dependent dehydrogenase (short-subunit alcohol dehydrogenase family)
MSRILITGAARGIGAETAKRLAGRGHDLALLGLEPELLEAIAAATHGRATAYEVDVCDRDALDSVVAEAARKLGGLDVAMANAGIASGGTVKAMDPDMWEKIIAVNLVGVYRTIHAALPHLIESRGYALPVASIAAMAHAPLMSAYCASKAGVEAFADSLRVEVAHHGVDVGCAYFSWIDTEMVRGADRISAFEKMRSTLNPPFSKTYPVSVAADAVVTGIEKRSKRVCGPGWIRAVQPWRGMIEPAIRREGGKHMPEIERLYDAEVAERGAAAASAPVGAGGAASLRPRPEVRT